MEFLYLVAGITVGFGLGYLLKSNKSGIAEIDNGKNDEWEKLIPENAVLQATVSAKEEQINKLELDIKDEREGHDYAKNKLAKAEQTLLLQKEKIASQKIEIDNLHHKLSKEFESIANRILHENTNQLSKINNERLGLTLKPLGEKIKAFEEKIEQNGKEREGLKEQIKLLHDLNKNMAQEAKNLTKALKGDSKQQGNWGEMILEKILEDSGLVKGKEYKLEHTTYNQEGVKIRPDAIINLPDRKHVVVDSKVSLTAYEQLVNAENEHERDIFMRRHVDSVKNHIKQLSEKSYQTSVDLNTPDFVLLFMPIEASFSVALQASPDIFTFAWEKRIVLVSPTTLLATLRTIASIWKQERQTKNAIEIARQSGAMYDKFVAFVEDLKKIGVQLHHTQKSYDLAFNKLTDGKGTLISRAEKLKELGARTSKDLDSNLLDS